jgi:asparagine synthase (glutamine-hydrolysing)
MCGIAGIVRLTSDALSPNREALLRMASALSHRGPDEFGIYLDNHAGLAHARLSIIDLSTGQQPMSDGAEATWIVFNGEIFNYVELRQELTSLGHHFRTQSDTEVIIHAYREWGDAAFERFNGQWAVALWEPSEQKLVLSRDRVGICPLHLCEHAGNLYFASEVKAIFAAGPHIPKAFDPTGISQTFTFWTIVPPHGVFQGVTELEPGHVRTYRNGTAVERAYWVPRYPLERDSRGEFSGSLEAAVAEVRKSLENATSLRMLRADVPVGSYLSGGLDSSLVAALGRQFAGDRFHTFSLQFEDSEYDETEFQRSMVKKLGSEHHQVMVSRNDIARVFPDVIYHSERPILRTAPAPLFLLSKLVRDHGIKVVLTGEGADEMFAGYDIFREGKVRRFWGRQPTSAMRPRLLERLYPYLARSPVSQRAMARQFFGRNLAGHRTPGFAHDTRWQTTSALRRLFSKDMHTATESIDVVRDLLDDVDGDFKYWSSLAQDQHLEIRTLLSGYLLSSQGDRMLMSHSVEGRFPFLDKDVVELANSLPSAYKLRVLDEKHVVKRAAAGLVPREILQRKKQPYRAPDALSFVTAKAPDYIDDVLSEVAVRKANIFDPLAVTQLLKKCRSRGGEGQFSNTDNMALVGVLSTQLLYAQFIDSPPNSFVKIKLCVDIDKSSSQKRS